MKAISNDYNYREQSRLISDVTISEFTTHLSNENWESVFSCHDINSKFNNEDDFLLGCAI
jgi:hypothetical protein